MPLTYGEKNPSDVILVPVITIKYVDTQTVLWNATNCTARVIPSVKINLSSPENQRGACVRFMHYKQIFV